MPAPMAQLASLRLPMRTCRGAVSAPMGAVLTSLRLPAPPPRCVALPISAAAAGGPPPTAAALSAACGRCGECGGCGCGCGGCGGRCWDCCWVCACRGCSCCCNRCAVCGSSSSSSSGSSARARRRRAGTVVPNGVTVAARWRPSAVGGTKLEPMSVSGMPPVMGAAAGITPESLAPSDES